MSDAILTEMKTIIEKNLPAEVGKTLQFRLARLVDLESITIDQANKLANANAQIATLKGKLECAGNLDKRKADLDQQEAALKEEQRELKHKLEIAGLKKDNAIEVKDAAVEIVKLVFCSPVSRKIIERSSRESEQGQLPGQSYVSEVRRKSLDEKTTENSGGPNLQG